MTYTEKEQADSIHIESATFSRFLTALNVVDCCSKWLLIICMLAMTILVVFQVVTRYFFAYSIAWADEVSRLAFVWSMFLAIPHGIRNGVHVGIDILLKKLPKTTFHLVTRCTMALCGILSLVVLYYGIGVTGEKMQELMPILNFTAAVYYIPVLLSMGHSALHFLVFVIGGTRAWEGLRT